MIKKITEFLVKYFPLIILGLGLVIYLNSFFNGFVWDDEEQVVNNLAIQSLSNIPYLFSQSTFNTGGAAGMGGMYYKPIMPLLFTLIHQFSGLNAWGYHFVQVLIHIGNSYLIYLIFCRFSKKNVLAALLSLIFLVHPGNSETVLYVSGLQDILFMFFGLLGFSVVLTKKSLSNKNWGVIFALLLLSILSKETGILFWLLFSVYFYFYRKTELSTFLRYLSLLFGLYLVLRLGLAGVGLNENKLSPIMLSDFATRLQTLPKIIFYYLRLIFFPYNLAISQHWVVRQITWTEFYLPLTISALFFIGLLTLCLKYKRRSLWFFSILLIIGLGLHSQLIPLDMTVSERWLYFPLFGMLGIVLILFENSKIKQTTLVGILLFVILLLSVRTLVRIPDWRSGLSLYVKDEPLAKGNFDFENNLGVYLHRDGKHKQALPHYVRSTEIAPHWWTNWNNLGVSYQMNNKPKKAEQAFLKAIKNGDYYLAYENYANLLLKQKRYKGLLKFLEQKALPKFPYNQRLAEIYQFAQQQNAN